MSSVSRADAFQRRHRVLGFPLAVVYKFFEDSGMHLVATMAYYALVASFPVALLTAAIVEAVVTVTPSLREPLQHSLLGGVPLVRGVLSGQSTATSSALGLSLATAVSLYGGLGVAGAFQHAMNQVWAVPRNARPNPFRTRWRSLVLLVLVIASVVISSLIAGSGDPRSGGVATSLGHWAIFLVNVLLVTAAMHYATAARTRWVSVLPGGIIAGLLWPWGQVQSMTALRDADLSTTKGVALAILGLLAILHIGALVVVMCAELNVVLARRLYPRALLTPFTDHVDLTSADRASYSAQAASQRFKGYQKIDVQFLPRPDRPDRSS